MQLLVESLRNLVYIEHGPLLAQEERVDYANRVQIGVQLVQLLLLVAVYDQVVARFVRFFLPNLQREQSRIRTDELFK